MRENLHQVDVALNRFFIQTKMSVNIYRYKYQVDLISPDCTSLWNCIQWMQE